MPSYPPSSAAHITGCSHRVAERRRKQLLLLWLCPSPAGTTQPSVHGRAPTSTQYLIRAVSLQSKPKAELRSQHATGVQMGCSPGEATPAHQRQRKPRMDRCCAERALTELHVGAAVQQGQGTHVDVAPQITSPRVAAQHAGFGHHVGAGQPDFELCCGSE